MFTGLETEVARFGQATITELSTNLLGEMTDAQKAERDLLIDAEHETALLAQRCLTDADTRVLTEIVNDREQEFRLSNSGLLANASELRSG